MQHSIVEGEPGIFPAPIASLMQKIRGFFDRKSDRDAPTGPDRGSETPDETPPPKEP